MDFWRGIFFLDEIEDGYNFSKVFMALHDASLATDCYYSFHFHSVFPSRRIWMQHNYRRVFSWCLNRAKQFASVSRGRHSSRLLWRPGWLGGAGGGGRLLVPRHVTRINGETLLPLYFYFSRDNIWNVKVSRLSLPASLPPPFRWMFEVHDFGIIY